MLFNEPKLLKSLTKAGLSFDDVSFSALQRAEIAEIFDATGSFIGMEGFSALQRAEIAETPGVRAGGQSAGVSVLFNEPKLLKLSDNLKRAVDWARGFSALQRAEIAEIDAAHPGAQQQPEFQCSSTSRNC